MKKIKFIFTLCLLSTFLGGSSLFEVGNLGINLFDIFTVLLVVSLTLYVIKYRKIKVKKILPHTIVPIFYVMLILSLSLTGLMIYSYPVHYIFEAFRWFQFIILFIAAMMIYNNQYDEDNFLIDMDKIIKISLVFNFFMLILQVLHSSEIISNSHILGFWHGADATSVNHGYSLGYHIGRYAGGFSNPSGLGALSALYLGYFISNLFFDFNRSKFTYLFTILAFVLLLASGHRTSFVSASIILFVILLEVISSNIDIFKRFLIYSLIFILGIIMITPILLNYNIGRLDTSGRYEEMLGIQRIVNEAMGGRTSTWAENIEFAFSEYSPVFGTMANASWVLDDLATMDSYYALSFAQGGPLLTFLFLFSVFLAVYTLFKYKNYSKQSYFLGVFFILIIVISSINQNTMTGNFGKSLFTLSFICVNFIYNVKLNCH